MVRISTRLSQLCLILFMMIFIAPSFMTGAMAYAHQSASDATPVAVMVDCHSVVAVTEVDCCANGLAEAMSGLCAAACLSMASGCMTAPALLTATLTLPSPNLLSLTHPAAAEWFASISARPDTPPPKA